MYIVAEDVYKGKAKEIGAVGLEILYYKIAKGFSLDSDEIQKYLIKMIVDEKEDLHGVSNAVLGQVQGSLFFILGSNSYFRNNPNSFW